MEEMRSKHTCCFAVEVFDDNQASSACFCVEYVYVRQNPTTVSTKATAYHRRRSTAKILRREVPEPSILLLPRHVTFRVPGNS